IPVDLESIDLFRNITNGPYFFIFMEAFWTALDDPLDTLGRSWMILLGLN
ncbi:13255_t:CDS:2, partial [Funneliformis geosporum]